MKEIEERSRKEFETLEAEAQVPKKIRPIKEEYGELDRPEPADVIAYIREKFVDWDLYKIGVMQNLIRGQKNKNIL